MIDLRAAQHAMLVETEGLLRGVHLRVTATGARAHNFERLVDARAQMKAFGEMRPYIGEIACKRCRLSLKDCADFSPSCLA